MFTTVLASLLLTAVLAAPTPAPQDQVEPLKFGPENAAVWDDGVEASVASARIFAPTSNAVGLAPTETGVRITIKITNGTPAPLDLTDATVRLKTGADGTQAAQIFDIENGLSLGFEGTVAPGRSATAAYGFSVPPDNTDLLNVEITPADGYLTALFEGQAS